MAPAAASNGTLAMRSGPGRRRRRLGVRVAITNVVTRVFFSHTYLRCVSEDRQTYASGFLEDAQSSGCTFRRGIVLRLCLAVMEMC